MFSNLISVRNFVFFAFFFVSFSLLLLPSLAWYDTNYQYRTNFSVSGNVSGLFQNGIIPVKFNTSANFTSNCFDLLPVNVSDNSVYPYLFDSGCGTGTAYAWLLTNLTQTTSSQQLGFKYYNYTGATNRSLNPTPFNKSINAFVIFQNNLNNYGNDWGTGFSSSNASYLTGQYGNGFDTGNGLNNIQLGTPSHVFGGSDTTIKMWVKRQGAHANWAGFWDFATDSVQENVVYFENANNYLSMVACGNTITPASALINDDGNWHQIVGVVRGTSFELWTDGVKRGSGTVGACAGSSYARANLLMDSGLAGRTNNLILDNFMYLNRSWTESEITTDYSILTGTETEPQKVSGGGGGGSTNNSLIFSDGSVSPSSVTYGTQQAVTSTIIVQNQTTNGTVGAVYASIFGKNYTMTKTSAFSNSSGGGVFQLTFNWLTNVSVGSQTIKFYANETVGSTNQTDTNQDKTLTIGKGNPTSRLIVEIDGGTSNTSITLPSTSNVTGYMNPLGSSDLEYTLYRINTTSRNISVGNPATITTTGYSADQYGFVYGTLGGVNWTAGNSTPIGLTISPQASPSSNAQNCGQATFIVGIITLVAGIGLLFLVAKNFLQGGGVKGGASLLVTGFATIIIGIALITQIAGVCV